MLYSLADQRVEVPKHGVCVNHIPIFVLVCLERVHLQDCCHLALV